MSPRSFTVGLLVASVLALALRLYGLGEPEYWLDELHSLADSASQRAEFDAVGHDTIVDSNARTTCLTPHATVSAVWERMREDRHPPLYFALLLAWRRLVGDGEFAVRLLSVLFSVAALFPAAMILYDLGRARAGLLFAFLLAGSFTPMQMAQDARPYGLAIFLVSLSYWAVVRVKLSPPDASGSSPAPARWRWLLVYGVSTYLALMTHYFTALALLGLLFFARQLGPRAKAVGFVAGIAAALFALSWGASLVAQVPLMRDQAWLAEAGPDHGLRTLLRLASAPIRLLFAVPPLAPAAAGGALLQVILLAWLARRRSTAALLLAGWYVVPVLTLAVIDLVSDMRFLGQRRYLCVASVALVGLVALALDELPRAVRWPLLGGMLLAAAATLPLPTPKNSLDRHRPRAIATLTRSGDLIVLDRLDRPLYWAVNLYPVVAYRLDRAASGKSCSAEPQRLPFLLVSQPPRPELLNEIAGFERLVVIVPHPPAEGDPNPLPQRFLSAGPPDYVPGVGFVYVFARNPA